MTEEEIRRVALEILENGNMEDLTAKKVRELVSEKTGVDMSGKDRKKLVLDIVDGFVAKKQREQSDRGEKRSASEESEDNGSRAKMSMKRFKAGESGELIVCELSARRKVSVSEFKGRLLVSIREYYEKNGKELPSSKGISLSLDQWEKLTEHIEDVNAAIKQANGDEFTS